MLILIFKWFLILPTIENKPVCSMAINVKFLTDICRFLFDFTVIKTLLYGSFLIDKRLMNGLDLLLPLIFHLLILNQLLEIIGIVLGFQFHWHGPTYHFVYLAVVHFICFKVKSLEVFWRFWFYLDHLFRWDISDCNQWAWLPITCANLLSVRIVFLRRNVFIYVWLLFEIRVKLCRSLLWIRYVFLSHCFKII